MTMKVKNETKVEYEKRKADEKARGYGWSDKKFEGMFPKYQKPSLFGLIREKYNCPNCGNTLKVKRVLDKEYPDTGARWYVYEYSCKKCGYKYK